MIKYPHQAKDLLWRGTSRIRKTPCDPVWAEALAWLRALPPGRVYAGFAGDNWGATYRFKYVPMHALLLQSDLDDPTVRFERLDVIVDLHRDDTGRARDIAADHQHDTELADGVRETQDCRRQEAWPCKRHGHAEECVQRRCAQRRRDLQRALADLRAKGHRIVRFADRAAFEKATDPLIGIDVLLCVPVFPITRALLEREITQAIARGATQPRSVSSTKARD